MPLLFFFLFFPFSIALGQTIKGITVEQNSGKKPVPEVQLQATWANPTVSNSDGSFQLIFTQLEVGESVTVNAQKNGWEIVNERALLTQIPHPDNQELLQIILCKAGTLTSNRLKYYNISKKIITQKYENKIANLQQAQKNWSEEKEQLQKEKKELLKLARELADKFARTNFDDLSSTYKEAFDLYLQGDIDAAIQLLENVNLLEQIKKRQEEKVKIEQLQDELKEQAIANEKGLKEDLKTMLFQANLYALKFDYDKAGFYYDKIAQIDSNNIDNLMLIASFWNARQQHDKAFYYYKHLRQLPIKDWRRGSIYRQEGLLYEDLGQYSNALEKYELYHGIFDNYHKANPQNNFVRSQLIRAKGLIGHLHQRLGDYNKALELFQQEHLLAQSAYEQTPNLPKSKFQLATTLGHLAYLQQTMGNFNESFEFAQKCYQLAAELEQTMPSNATYMQLVGLACGFLGEHYLQLRNLEKTTAFTNKETKITQHLLQQQPYDINYQKTHCILLQRAGRIHQLKENPKAALSSFKEAHKLANKLFQKHQNSKDIQHLYATTTAIIGEYYQPNQKDSAKVYFEEARSHFKALQEDNPKNELFGNTLARTYIQLGQTIQIQQPQQAFIHFEHAYALIKTLFAEHPNNERTQLNWAIINRIMGEQYENQQKVDKAKPYFDKALQLYKEFVHKNPKNIDFQAALANLYKGLGSFYINSTQYDKAVAYYKKAEHSFQALYKQTQNEKYQKDAVSAGAAIPRVLSTNYFLASSIEKSSSPQEAIGLFKINLEMAQALYKADTTNLDMQNTLMTHYQKLGELHQKINQSSKAINYYLPCFQLAKKQYLAKIKSTELLSRLINLSSNIGMLYQEYKELDYALTYFSLGISVINEKLKVDSTATTQHNKAAFHMNVAKILQLKKDYTKALQAAEQAYPIILELHETADENKKMYTRNLVPICETLGELHQLNNSNTKALFFYDKMRAYLDTLYQNGSQDLGTQSYLAYAHTYLGNLYHELDSFPQALIHLEKNVALSKALSEQVPDDVELKSNLAVAYTSLGLLYQDMQESEKALSCFENDLLLTKALYNAFPSDSNRGYNLIISYENLGDFLMDTKQKTEALFFYNKAKKMLQTYYQQDKDESDKTWLESIQKKIDS